MDKDKVLELINGVGRKLHLEDYEVAAILKTYRGFVRYAKGHEVPVFRLGKNKTCWNNVLGSMSEYPQRVKWTEQYCPECRERLLEIWYSTPRIEWEAMAGSAGYLKVCLNCFCCFDYRENLIS